MAKIESKKQAQDRVNRIAAFRDELAALTAEGVTGAGNEFVQITEYHTGLLARLQSEFDVDLDPRGRQLGRGMKIASGFGALAFSASLFFLFVQFWGFLDTPVQVVLLVLASLGSLAATFAVASISRMRHFVDILALVAFACFVLNIAILGQVFNLTSSQNALLLWSLYAFILAYAFDLRLLLAAAILCLYGFIAARVGTWSGMYWLSVGERPENFFIPALLIFAVPVAIDHTRRAAFATIYQVSGLIGFFLPVLVLSNWGSVSYLRIDPHLVEGGYQTVGFAASALAIWLGVRKAWQPVMSTGIVFFVLFLFTKFFDWWWEWMPKSLFFLVIGMTALLAVFIFRRLRGAP